MKLTKIINTVFLLFFVTIFTQCNSSTGEGGMKEMAQDADFVAIETSKSQPSEPNTTDDLASTKSSEKSRKTKAKIIKTAHLRYQVKKYEEANIKIKQFIEQYDAYIASENESNEYNTKRNYISIRVNFVRFDSLVHDLLTIAHYVEKKNITAQDVTEEFVDIQARLKTKRELESRYLALLEKATTVKEMLEVEAALQTIREAIESTEGRLKYLQDQVGYSTIHLNFYQQNANKLAPTNFFNKTGNAIADGWHIFLEFLIVLIAIWPFLVILLLFIFLFIRWRKKRGKA